MEIPVISMQTSKVIAHNTLETNRFTILDNSLITYVSRHFNYFSVLMRH